MGKKEEKPAAAETPNTGLPKKLTEHHRFRTDKAYNLHLVGDEHCDPDTRMPILEPVFPDQLQATTLQSYLDPPQKNRVAHFFLDDYRFERVWNSPEKYLEKLADFGAVTTPDFSLYVDMPAPMQLWNVYRSRALGNWWQSQGLTVIPTLQWATPSTYGFALEGLPEGGVYAVSTVGVVRDKAQSHLFRMGLEEALSITKPSMVLAYGAKVDNLNWGNTKVVWSQTDSTRRIKASKRVNTRPPRKR